MIRLIGPNWKLRRLTGVPILPNSINLGAKFFLGKEARRGQTLDNAHFALVKET